MFGQILISLMWMFAQIAEPADNQQLRALDHYEGAWDVTLTIEALTDSGQDQQFTGEVTGKWIVDGHFLEQIGRYRIGDQTLTIKTIMSFDSKQDRYHYWYFLSGGEVRESTGSWNESQQKMTSTMRDPDNQNVTTFTADFSEAGVERWLIETQNNTGLAVTRIRGTNTRR